MSGRRRVRIIAAAAVLCMTAAGCSSGWAQDTATRRGLSSRRLPASSPGASRQSAAARSLPQRSPSPYPALRSRLRPAVPLPAPTGAREQTATGVALAGVRAWFSYDTGVDSDPNGTAERASAWLTPSFAVQVRRSRPVAAPGAQWNGWAAHRAYLRVTTSLGGDDHPPDTAASAVRQVIAVLRPVGRDGWRGPVSRQVVFVVLARARGDWRVAGIQVS